MQQLHHRQRVALAGALVMTTTLAVGLPAASADGPRALSAAVTTLAGPWAPFTNCPVDDPVMLEAPSTTFGTVCVSSASTHGTITIRDTTANTGTIDVQFGVTGTADEPRTGHEVAAAGGRTVVAEPAVVPGGLTGLMGPLAELLAPVNRVTATAEPAGVPSDFSAGAALSVGRPIVTLPIKIHLRNPVLGPNCYIGSDQNPIVLHPENTVVGSGAATPDPNGFPMSIITLDGVAQKDDTFAVPRATGCGIGGLLNGALNQRVGLPSPSGMNTMVLEGVTANVVLNQQGGQVLSDAWHASCLTGC